MSTKKATATATVCAGCEKRDATIKRQAAECADMKECAEYWFADYCKARAEYDETAHARDILEGMRGDLSKTCADIRAVCVDAGIEHADKMATLTAVKALAENDRRHAASYHAVHQLQAHLSDVPTLCLAFNGIENGVPGVFIASVDDKYVSRQLACSMFVAAVIMGAVAGAFTMFLCA